MLKVSGGLLPFATESGELEVFLVHPGGPYFAHQNEGIWSVAKGILEEGEAREVGARREFEEETGVLPPTGPYLDLGEVTLRSGKVVFVFGFQAERSLAFVASNEFEIEWPKRSGNLAHFPEVDRAEWFTIRQAKRLLLPGQLPFLDRLVMELNFVAPGDEIGA